jgi:hypothetical protein
MANPPRGHRRSLRLNGLPLRKGALGERDDADVTEKATHVKSVDTGIATRGD